MWDQQNMCMDVQNKLAAYVDALRPIIYIEHFDFDLVDQLIAETGQNAKIYEYNHAYGLVNFKTKSPEESYKLATFLKTFDTRLAEQDIFLVLKDVHDEMTSPNIIALLKSIAQKTQSDPDYHMTIFIVSSRLILPPELEKWTTIFEIPLPDKSQIKAMIQNFASDLQIEIKPNLLEELSLELSGLHSFEATQLLNLAYQEGGEINEQDKELIRQEKLKRLERSEFLTWQTVVPSMDEIGGMRYLKQYLHRKAEIFNNLDTALAFGISRPKGILITGMPGCGKSTIAKASAHLFSIPLIRFSAENVVLSRDVQGEHLDEALKVVQAMSPCILWLDEIEKAFLPPKPADQALRFSLRFLRWIEENTYPVFSIVTCNYLSKLPLEWLRKGRFDETFFIPLPHKKNVKKFLNSISNAVASGIR